eukprot:6212308-Pleurochrysis_carterae.AAC.5
MILTWHEQSRSRATISRIWILLESFCKSHIRAMKRFRAKRFAPRATPKAALHLTLTYTRAAAQAAITIWSRQACMNLHTVYKCAAPRLRRSNAWLHNLSKVDGQGGPVVVEVLHARLRYALELGDLLAQPLVLCAKLLDLCRQRLHVEELAIRTHLVVRVLRLELLEAEAQARELLPLFGDLLAADRQLLGLLVDLLTRRASSA